MKPVKLVPDKTFIWDLHGTLEINNEKAVVEVTNIILSQEGYKARLSLDKCIELYGRKWIDLIRGVLPNMSADVYTTLAKRCVKYSLDNPDITRKHIEASPSARNVLETIAAQDYDQILISNTQPEAIQMFLSAIGLEGIFDANRVLAVDSIDYNPAKTKISVLSEYLSSRPYKSLVVIGDTQEDVDMGKAFRAKTYLFRNHGMPQIKTDADSHIYDLNQVLCEVLHKDHESRFE